MYYTRMYYMLPTYYTTIIQSPPLFDCAVRCPASRNSVSSSATTLSALIISPSSDKTTLFFYIIIIYKDNG